MAAVIHAISDQAPSPPPQIKSAAIVKSYSNSEIELSNNEATNIAKTLRSIADEAASNSGLVAKAIRVAQKAAKKGTYKAVLSVSKNEFQCKVICAKLIEYGFNVEWDYKFSLLPFIDKYYYLIVRF